MHGPKIFDIVAVGAGRAAGLMLAGLALT